MARVAVGTSNFACQPAPTVKRWLRGTALVQPVGAADVGSLLRCHGGNGERRSRLPCDLDGVGQRGVARARGLVADENASQLFAARLHKERSGELWSKDSDSTP